MKKSLLGSLRESCRPQARGSLRESRRSLKEMFGDDGELIQVYGALISEVDAIRDAITKRRESVLDKIGDSEGDSGPKVEFARLFTDFFQQTQDNLSQLETSLKQMETGGVPVAELQSNQSEVA